MLTETKCRIERSRPNEKRGVRAELRILEDKKRGKREKRMLTETKGRREKSRPNDYEDKERR